MVIDSYNVNASASRTYTKVEQQSVSASVWGGGMSTTAEKTKSGVEVSLSDLAKEMLEETQNGHDERQAKARTQAGGVENVSSNIHVPSNPYELKLKMLESFISALTGRKVNLTEHFQGILNKGQSPRGVQMNPAALATGGGSGGRITATQFQYEAESVTYNAKGVINTADGKQITVDVNMHMSREFAAYSQASLEWGAPEQNCIDPLVINYGGAAASLTGQKYDFDLDADGALDKISFAGPGSGFLALDKNGDGKINDGSELFGPNTGNGFEELRAYDKDGNGWIDESDDIFDKLRIWSKDANGNDQLYTLRQLDVGAIYLGDVQTEFSMKDNANNTNGIMRSTSFYLKESGGAGTVSHIDLVV